MSTEVKTEDSGEISINFGEIYQALKKYKLSITFISLFFAGLGAFYSLTLNSEYASEVKILPEADSKTGGAAGSLGGLSSLAGLAGVNLSGSMAGIDAIQPAMYPEIIQSVPFLQELAASNVYNPKKKRLQKLSEYFAEDNRNAPIPLTDTKPKMEKDVEISILPKGAISADMININQKETQILNAIKESISVEVDKKTNLIKINSTAFNPVIAANLSDLVLNQLTRYIIRYRTEKVRKDLNFLTNRQAEARKRYDQALFILSNYKDQNRNVFLNVAKDQGKKLQYEVDLAFNIYSNLTSQLSETTIKLQKETPVFKVLAPAQVPLKRSSPKRSLITLGSLFLGLFISLIYVFFKSVNLKELLS
jgi:uncharacterized protein involved in exopolysaccharide biosynthesis